MTPAQQAAIDAAQARLGGSVTTPGGQTFTPAQIKIMEEVAERIKSKAYDVIKTLPDGSQVLQFNDGTLQVLNQEAGLASKDPEVVNAAMRGESPVEKSKQQRAEEILDQPGASIGAKAANFLEGVPFIGSYTDELIADTPRQEAQIRGLQSSLKTESPAEALALQAAGGVTGGAVLGLAGAEAGAASLLNRLAQLPRAKRYLSYLGLGTVGGATEGGIYGYGQGTTAEDRQRKAQEGALMSGGITGAMSVGMPAIGNTLAKGYAQLKTALTRKDVTNIARELGVSPEAAKVIQSVVQQGDADLADMLAAIDRAGDQGMIADADVATQVLLDAAAATEGGALAIARGAVEGRAKEAGQSLETTMDETLVPQPRIDGQAVDVRDIAEDISLQTREARQEAYNQAYNTPIQYGTDAGQSIMAVLNRIPASTLNRAIQEANDTMKTTGVGQKQIIANLDQQGNLISFAEEPNVVQLDYIKRALGTIGSEVDQFGRPTAEAGRAMQLYRELSGSLSEAVPAYRTAVELGGDKIGRDRALEIGEKILDTNVTPRQVLRDLAGLDEGQKIYARAGLRDRIQRTIENVKATIASPDADINALRTILRDLSSKANQAKVKTVIGAENATKLFRELEKANAALSLRAAIAVNSKTATRQALQKQIGEITEPGALQTLAQGEPLAATQQIIQAVTGATGEYTAAKKGEIMKEIARAMTSARGEEAKRQLKVVYDAVKENRATQAQMQQAADFLVNSVTLPATIFGVQTQTRDTNL